MSDLNANSSHDRAKKIGEILRLRSGAVSQDVYVDGIEMDGDWKPCAC